MPISEIAWWAITGFLALWGLYYLCATLWALFHPRVSMSTGIMTLRAAFTAVSWAIAYGIFMNFLR